MDTLSRPGHADASSPTPAERYWTVALGATFAQGGSDFPDLENWWGRITLDDPNTEEQLEVGYGTFYFLDVLSAPDIFDPFDAESGDLSKIAGVLLSDGVIEQMPLLTHILIVDRVQIESSYRGQGLGPRLVATAVDRLCRGRTALSALLARPDGWRNMSPRTLRTATRKVKRAWEQVGFHDYRDGVMLLDEMEYETPFPLD